MPFIPGAIKPLKKCRTPLCSETVPFWRQGWFPSLNVLFPCPLNTPPSPPGASKHCSLVLTSRTHDQTSPDTQGSEPLTRSGAEQRLGDAGLEEGGSVWVEWHWSLEMGSDLLTVTPLDGDRAQARSSWFRFPVLYGTKSWALARFWALCFSRPPRRGESQEKGAGPAPGLSVLLRLSWLLLSSFAPPLPSPARHLALRPALSGDQR